MLRQMFYFDNFLAFPTEMFRKELLTEFPENLIAQGDCNFHIKTLLKTNIKVLEDYLVTYNIFNIDQHVSSWCDNESNLIERISILDNFFNMDEKTFKNTFKNYFENYISPNKDIDVKFLIILIALYSNNYANNFWAKLKLSYICSDSKTFNTFMKYFNFNYQNFIKLRKIHHINKENTYTKKILSIIKHIFGSTFRNYIKQLNMLKINPICNSNK